MLGYESHMEVYLWESSFETRLNRDGLVGNNLLSLASTSTSHLLMIMFLARSLTVNRTYLRRPAIFSYVLHQRRAALTLVRKLANMEAPKDCASSGDIYESFFRPTSRRWM